MKVPLITDTYINYGEQYIRMWYNSGEEHFKSPILPYVYTENEPPMEAKVDVVKRKLLYDPTHERELFKCSFKNTKELYDACSGSDFYESKFQFKDRLYVDCPELVTKYANTDDLKIMCFDFEMCTDNTGFPKPETHAIIACGLQFDDGPIELILADTAFDDKDILEKFLVRIEEEDPDILCGFNSNFFDLVYLCERLKINGMNPGRLSRDGNQPYFVKDKYVKLGGRISYDLYPRSVSRDQKLFEKAPPNRKMKTVCKVYNLPDVVEEPPEVMSNMKAMVGTEELKLYLTSDIRCTKFLCDMYLPEIINMAETIGVSLESCLNSSPSYIGHMLFSHHFSAEGVISDKTVEEANPEYPNRQGAYVGCYKPGLYKDGQLRKFDVQSFYPNLIRTLNLSPETTRIVRLESKLRPYEAHMDHERKILSIAIPDEVANKQVICEVDFGKRGFASSFVDKLMSERLAMKSAMKKLSHGSPEYAELDVNQLSRKVILNSVSGYFGQNFASWGSLASYEIITGSGRYLITKFMEQTGMDKITALDTDGFVHIADKSINELNAWVEEYILNFYEVPKNYIHLEEEVFEAAYFREGAKQYLLLERESDGTPKLVIHGASFKGSNLLKLYTNIIEDIGLKLLLLDESDTVAVKQFEADIAKYYDRSTWTLDMLAKRNKCKPRNQYKSANTIGMQLVEQYEKKFNTTMTNETQLEYVKVKNKHGSTYKLVTIFDDIADITDIDYSYYGEIVDNAFERLNLLDKIPRNIKAGKQANLFAFF